MLIFAHGSGSSRRNRYVAGVLNQACLARRCSTAHPRRRSATGANAFGVELLADGCGV
jgi:hypothetical protein